MASLSTGHEDMIHDAQVDFYGRRVASCSSDRTIRVFDLLTEHPTLLAELRGHEGPVWQISWAHPKFGNLLASCSYDRKVIVWKETSPNVWSPIYEYRAHEGSVNSVAWGPHEYGAVLACASSDGCVSVLNFRNGVWSAEKFEAHKIGCNAVSWAPAIRPGALLDPSKGGVPQEGGVGMMLVTGGCDELVRIWRFGAEGSWVLDDTLSGHKGWVRDVAWAPSVGLPSGTIASCSQDQSVIVWAKDDSSASWTARPLLPPPKKFADVVWRVSWSVTGSVLAVACGDNKVTLWKEALDGHWNCLSGMEEPAKS